MLIQPVDETEYVMRNVWPKGTYPCTIVKAEEGNSQKTGDPFFKCEVQVFHSNGGFKTITTYVMAAGKAAWQLRSAAEAFGVLEKYRAGGVDAIDFEGKNAFAKLGIEEDETGQYPPKNTIREFTSKPPKSKATNNDGPPPGHPAAADMDDTIPF
jgi:hypothetical protein